jgi:hypothetical protein
MTNEAIEWRANYDEMLTRHKEVHEELLSKQQKLNRQLDEATRKADKEAQEKSVMLSDAWLTFAEYDVRNWTRAKLSAPPCLPPPGQVRGRLEELSKRDRPDDEELILEKELAKLLSQIKDQKETCAKYHQKLLDLGVAEDDIQDCFPEDHPDNLKRKRAAREKEREAMREKLEKVEQEKKALEEAEAKRKADEEEALAKKRGGGGGKKRAASVGGAGDKNKTAATATKKATSKPKPTTQKPVKTG